MKSGVISVSLGVLAAVALSGAAFAGHGKVGLWQITTKMDMGNVMAQIPPEQAAKMKAMGIHIPNNNSFTVTHCMTADEVAMDKLPKLSRPGHESDCDMQNLKTSGQTVSADMVCHGKDVQGTGHFALTYDSAEHYAGKMTMNMVTNGQPMSSTTSFEAHWISADCKAPH